LSDAEIAAVQAAPPGEVPAHLALHLAACARCQQRALFGDAPRRATRRRTVPDGSSIRRALILGLLALAAMATFFWSLWHMTAQMR